MSTPRPNLSARGHAAIAAARRQSVNGPTYGVGQCLMRTRALYGALAIGDYDHDGAADAEDGWKATKHKHTGTHVDQIPAGVPVWWSGGSHDNGHVAVSAGAGFCWSLDIKRPGRFDKVRITTIAHEWGLTFLGWTEEINGVTAYTPAPATPAHHKSVDQRAAQAIKTRRPAHAIKRPRVLARINQIIRALTKGTLR